MKYLSLLIPFSLFISSILPTNHTPSNFLTESEAYKILECAQNATDQEIKDAYKKKAYQYHPNFNLNNQAKANEKMKLVNEAYEKLTKKRKVSNSSSLSQPTTLDEFARMIQEEITRSGATWTMRKIDYSTIPLTGNDKLDREIKEMCKKTKEKSSYDEMRTIIFFLKSAIKNFMNQKKEVREGTITRRGKQVQLSEKQQKELLEKFEKAEEALYQEAIREKEYIGYKPHKIWEKTNTHLEKVASRVIFKIKVKSKAKYLLARIGIPLIGFIMLLGLGVFIYSKIIHKKRKKAVKS